VCPGSSGLVVICKLCMPLIRLRQQRACSLRNEQGMNGRLIEIPSARIRPTLERTNRGSLRLVKSIGAPQTVRQTLLELLNRLIAIQATGLILTYIKADSKMIGLSVLQVRCLEKMFPVSFQTSCLETLKLMASNCMND
jgi:hypothetical protein